MVFWANTINESLHVAHTFWFVGTIHNSLFRLTLCLLVPSADSLKNSLAPNQARLKVGTEPCPNYLTLFDCIPKIIEEMILKKI